MMIPPTDSLRAPDSWGARLVHNLKALIRGAVSWLRITFHRPTRRERHSAKDGTGALSFLTGPIGFLPAALVADALEILVAWEADLCRWALMRGRRLGLSHELQAILLQEARRAGGAHTASLTLPIAGGEWLECYIQLGERSYPKVAGLIWRSWPGRTSSAIRGGFISTPFGKMHYCRRVASELPEPEDEDPAGNLPF
jgi:hypothetical protein